MRTRPRASAIYNNQKIERDILMMAEKYKLLRDERVMELETENAILHLKLAQAYVELLQQKKDKITVRRLFAAEYAKNRNVTVTLSKLQEDFRDLKHQLSSLVQLLSTHQQNYNILYANALRQASNLTNQLIAKSSLQKQDNLHRLQGQLVSIQSQMSSVQLKYEREKMRRKTLHNNLVELRGNIRVHCRLRPLLNFDLVNVPESSKQPVTFADDEETVLLYYGRSSLTGAVTEEKMFEFDRVYNETEDTGKVFAEVKPLLTSVLDGYNVCIMAYGQTGSGKTHTMLGPEGGKTDNQNGVIPLAVEELFKLIEKREKDTERTHTIMVTVAEVYNEQIRDLLMLPGQQENVGAHNTLPGCYGSEVSTLTSQEVTTSFEVMEIIQITMRQRAEGVTNIHSHSSRSHLVVSIIVTSAFVNYSVSSTPMMSSQGSPYKSFSNGVQVMKTINMHCKNISQIQSGAYFTGCIPRSADSSLVAIQQKMSRYKTAAGPLKVSTSSTSLLSMANHISPSICKTKLQLVDLAGSECVGMSGVTGAALKEAQSINKSLSALSDVLTALAEHRNHIPYRNSTLTHLLKESIGGDAKLLLMVCVSPTKKYIAETMKCLQFGSQARQIAKKPSIRSLKKQQQGQVSKSQLSSSKR